MKIASPPSIQSPDLSSATDALPHNSKVAILICTYNGARFLREQLDSFVRQTHQNWSIYASDDGSSDETLQILNEYQFKLGNGRLSIFQGPKQGFAKNFFSLVRNPAISADYFAFSDQDDIWFENKLERSITQLATLSKNTPSLYCSRTLLVNSKKKKIGHSPLFKKPTSFQNALVQSIAGANTMLINNASRKLILRLADNTPVVAHDWLAYLLVSGCGGKVIYDPVPTLSYRQHEGNLIGANADLKNQILRIRKMLSGRFSEWSTLNLIALNSIKDYLTDENQQRLRNFEQARKSSFIPRLRLMGKSGAYRQTLKGNISLLIATVLNKI
ncbi:glycosyltransferase family 2 protein [Pseudomonas sp. BE134]|uniref:glycosyltransferase family 2 protein n=1 Tax=Pseudomonas sp. BE134 TaxID=2817843 RepID=UPI002863D9D7|nr:glycosyltransferase family 2 protein [Pseudomonas sp. BE134]MDR6927992.1 glycosyltransferase involved in cell wall biosynthesis [Pseudomonas sp. BE134]